MHPRRSLAVPELILSLLLLTGCASHGPEATAPSAEGQSKVQTGSNVSGEPFEPIYESPHEEDPLHSGSLFKGPSMQNVEVHDLDVTGEGRPMRQVGRDDLDETSLQGSPVPDLITPTPFCVYTAAQNVNCRASDYPESSLIAILMQGEQANLLYLNPTFTHGKFDAPGHDPCWIPLELMEGPSDPFTMCMVDVISAPPSIEGATDGGSSPSTCSADLDEAQCKAAGGTWESGGAAPGSGICKCN